MLFIDAVCTLRQVQLFETPIDCSPPGSSVHGIITARILEWVAISSSRDLPDPGIEPMSPALAGGLLATEPSGKPYVVYNCSAMEPAAPPDRELLDGSGCLFVFLSV